MLAIGGCTVDELKERMTHDEMLDWISYAKLNGPLNPMLRFDAAVARLCVIWGGGKVKDHMPWPQEEEREATIEDVFAILKSARKPEKK